jgi:hypothetical protein
MIQDNFTPQRVTVMLDDCAAAQNLAIVGGRLIAPAIADGIGGLRRHVMRRRDVEQPRHRPPIQLIGSTHPFSLGLEPHR